MGLSVQNDTKRITIAFGRHNFHLFVIHNTFAMDLNTGWFQERRGALCGRRNNFAIFIRELDGVSKGATRPIAIALMAQRIKHYLVVEFHLVLKAGDCFGVVAK
jgi:hypothetical protein